MVKALTCGYIRPMLNQEPPTNTPNRLILLVDDSSLARRHMVRALSIFHCDILEAANGREALDKISRRRPSLVLLDLNMPLMDGEQFLAELKSNPEHATIPVVVLSANEDQDTVNRLLQNGANDYMSKTSDTWQVVQKVRHYVPLPQMISV